MEIINSHSGRRFEPTITFEIDPADLGPVLSLTYGGHTYTYREGTGSPGHVQTNTPASYPDNPTNDPRFVSHYTYSNSQIGFTAKINPIDTPVLEWRWDFGDGVEGFGPSVTHTYITASPETSVRLTATLVDGRKFHTNQVINLRPGRQVVVNAMRANPSS